MLIYSYNQISEDTFLIIRIIIEFFFRIKSIRIICNGMKLQNMIRRHKFRSRSQLNINNTNQILLVFEELFIASNFLYVI
jgi:hypothetical protein